MWDIGAKLQALYLNTTASNTGRVNDASVLLASHFRVNPYKTIWNKTKNTYIMCQF